MYLLNYLGNSNSPLFFVLNCLVLGTWIICFPLTNRSSHKQLPSQITAQFVFTVWVRDSQYIHTWEKFSSYFSYLQTWLLHYPLLGFHSLRLRRSLFNMHLCPMSFYILQNQLLTTYFRHVIRGPSVNFNDTADICLLKYYVIAERIQPLWCRITLNICVCASLWVWVLCLQFHINSNVKLYENSKPSCVRKPFSGGTVSYLVPRL